MGVRGGDGRGDGMGPQHTSKYNVIRNHWKALTYTEVVVTLSGVEAGREGPGRALRPPPAEALLDFCGGRQWETEGPFTKCVGSVQGAAWSCGVRAVWGACESE